MIIMAPATITITPNITQRIHHLKPVVVVEPVTGVPGDVVAVTVVTIGFDDVVVTEVVIVTAAGGVVVDDTVTGPRISYREKWVI